MECLSTESNSIGYLIGHPDDCASICSSNDQCAYFLFFPQIVKSERAYKFTCIFYDKLCDKPLTNNETWMYEKIKPVETNLGFF